ncbi:MAG: hypothetical protein IJ881_10580, partial [Neisseriaceae bacterium]|nr:hypothetical protein [Neisseriaceae bacterium]
GGGFINANTVQLVSGSVKFDDGAVKGFNVDKQNAVEINGAGMDASGTEYTQIISAASKINAEIYGNTKNEIAINAVSGNVDEDGKGKNQGQVAVDVSNLGGMYAGKITLVGNERGFAVNNSGKLIAADRIHIDASGQVTNSQDALISSDKVDNKGQSLSNIGFVESNTASILIVSGSLKNNGQIASNGKTVLHSQKDNIDNKGKISSNQLESIAHDFNNSGTIHTNEHTQNLSGSLKNSGEINNAGKTSIIAKNGNIDNTGEINTAELTIQTGNLNNQKTGKVRAMSLISADLSSNLNNDGIIANNGTTQINAQNGNIENKGEMASNTLAITAADLTIKKQAKCRQWL